MHTPFFCLLEHRYEVYRYNGLITVSKYVKAIRTVLGTWLVLQSASIITVITTTITIIILNFIIIMSMRIRPI